VRALGLLLRPERLVLGPVRQQVLRQAEERRLPSERGFLPLLAFHQRRARCPRT
jgi:hypothetical protein